MSFKKIGSHYDKNLKEWLEHFEAEYESDLSALPEANPGSTCLVKETGKTVVMANNGVWGGGAGELPFGKETTTVKEVLPECHQPDNAELCIEEPINLVGGEEYIVTFRGVDYRCKAQKITIEGSSIVILGDGSQMGGTSNGEPFSITEYPAELAAQAGFAVYILGDGTADYTISIRQEVTEVQKISGKYVEGMGWTEREIGVIYENEAEGFSYDESYGYSWNTNYITTHLHDIVIGKKYTVVFDGVEYSDLVAFDDGAGYICVGTTPDKFTEDIPFCIGTGEYEGVSYMSVTARGDAPTHSISVTCIAKETIHPIDPKYLPKIDSGDSGSNVFIATVSWSDEVEDLVIDKTVDEFHKAFAAGKRLYLKYYDVYLVPLTCVTNWDDNGLPHKDTAFQFDLVYYEDPYVYFVSLRVNRLGKLTRFGEKKITLT